MSVCREIEEAFVVTVVRSIVVQENAIRQLQDYRRKKASPKQLIQWIYLLAMWGKRTK